MSDYMTAGTCGRAAPEGGWWALAIAMFVEGCAHTHAQTAKDCKRRTAGWLAMAASRQASERASNLCATLHRDGWVQSVQRRLPTATCTTSAGCTRAERTTVRVGLNPRIAVRMLLLRLRVRVPVRVPVRLPVRSLCPCPCPCPQPPGLRCLLLLSAIAPTCRQRP